MTNGVEWLFYDSFNMSTQLLQDYPQMKIVGISKNHQEILPSESQVDLQTHSDWGFSEPISFEMILPSHERHYIKLERKKWVDCLIAFINFFIDYSEYDLFKKYDHLLKMDQSDFKANSKQIYPLKRGFINTHSSTIEKVRIMRSIAHLYQVQVLIELQFVFKNDQLIKY